MRIVVLDGYTLNPGDLSWDGLDKLGEVTLYDRTAADEIISRAAGAAIVLTNKTPLTAETINQLPDLKYIGVLATGYNVVDVAAAKKRGVVVTNIPSYSTKSVAQLCFALLLELCHHVQSHSDAVKSGRWASNRDFCFWDFPLTELAGKTMGIIGFGRIGRQVADIAFAFGMKVMAHSNHAPTGWTPAGEFVFCGLDELLQNSDVVSLHCPLFPETKGMIDRDALRKMKKTAFLINTSRGPLIEENDLAEALTAGEIAGAAVDVLSCEPPEETNPLLPAPNCLITPHIAWATIEARTRLMDMAVNNVAQFIGGTPVNIVT